MGTFTNFGMAPPHDPMFGIQQENIAPRLTRNNWRTKATGRICDDRFLYVLIKQGEQRIGVRKCKRYYVRVYFGEPEDRSFNADFDRLMDALAYVNGHDGSAMALATTSATPREYPGNRGADIYVTGFTGQGRNRRSNFTIRLPNAI